MEESCQMEQLLQDLLIQLQLQKVSHHQSTLHHPVITLLGANPQVIQVGGVYTELSATVTDPDNVGLVAIINSSAVNTSVVGSYIVTYNAVDPAGNQAAQVTRIVSVVAIIPPPLSGVVITLSGQTSCQALAGTWTDASSTCTVSTLTIISGNTLVIASNVTLSNTGLITDLGTITNSGPVANSGTIANSGTLTNGPTGVITDSGTIINKNAGIITTSGTITLPTSGILTNELGGTVTNSLNIIN